MPITPRIFIVHLRIKLLFCLITEVFQQKQHCDFEICPNKDGSSPQLLQNFQTRPRILARKHIIQQEIKYTIAAKEVSNFWDLANENKI